MKPEMRNIVLQILQNHNAFAARLWRRNLSPEEHAKVLADRQAKTYDALLAASGARDMRGLLEVAERLGIRHAVEWFLDDVVSHHKNWPWRASCVRHIAEEYERILEPVRGT